MKRSIPSGLKGGGSILLFPITPLILMALLFLPILLDMDGVVVNSFRSEVLARIWQVWNFSSNILDHHRIPLWTDMVAFPDSLNTYPRDPVNTLLILPLYPFLHPVTYHNIHTLSLFLLAFLSFSLVARSLTGSTFPALFAGFAISLNPFVLMGFMDQFVDIMGVGYLSFHILALYLLSMDPGRKRGLIAGATLLLSFASSPYNGMSAAFSTLLLLLYWCALYKREGAKKRIRYISLSLLFGILISLPLLFSMAWAERREGGGFNRFMPGFASAPHGFPKSLLPLVSIYDTHNDSLEDGPGTRGDEGRAEMGKRGSFTLKSFPLSSIGMAPLFLLAIGLSSRRGRLWALFALPFMSFALPKNFSPLSLLFSILPYLDLLTNTHFFVLPVFAFLILSFSLSIPEKGWPARGIIAFGFLLILLDLFVKGIPIPLETHELRIRPVLSIIAEGRGKGAVTEFPDPDPPFGNPPPSFRRTLFHQTIHRKPVTSTNDQTPFPPRDYYIKAKFSILCSWIPRKKVLLTPWTDFKSDAKAFQYLKGIGVRYFLIHDDLLPGRCRERVHSILKKNLGDPSYKDSRNTLYRLF